MQNKAVEIKRKYEKKLTNAIQKAGGIFLKKDGVNIDYVSLAKPKGLFAIDNMDIDFIKIEAIIQEVSTGEVMLFNQEFGVMRFEFDFIGSKAQCYKYLHEQEIKNKIDVANLTLI